MTGPSHEQAIDALVERFFAFFDNRDGAVPRLADLASCFADKATIARRSGAGTELYTFGEFAAPRIDLLTRGALRDVHEWESAATTHVFDGIATRTSRYAKAGLLEGKPYGGSGTKCFLFVEVEAGWRIASVVWVDDAA